MKENVQEIPVLAEEFVLKIRSWSIFTSIMEFDLGVLRILWLKIDQDRVPKIDPPASTGISCTFSFTSPRLKC